MPFQAYFHAYGLETPSFFLDNISRIPYLSVSVPVPSATSLPITISDVPIGSVHTHQNLKICVRVGVTHTWESVPEMLTSTFSSSDMFVHLSFGHAV